MRFPMHILRTFLSLVLLLSFLFGSVAGAFASDASAASEAATKKQSQEEQAVKPSVSPEATVSAVSIKFCQVFADFIRQYVLLLDTVRVTDFGYPVFRDAYFAKIFSHVIVANAP